MIQPRKTDDSWSPDLRVTLNDAHDLQSLLDAIVRKYRLMSGVIARESGEVLAQSGTAVTDLTDLAAAIDPRVLPRYFANGPYDAYVDIIGGGMIALLMRERGSDEAERSQLAMVSDYNIAKDMTEELRTAVRRITAAGGP